MNDFKQAKEAYDAVPIPAELADRVRAGIRQGRKARERARLLRRAKRFALSAAACFAVLLAGLNLSPGFSAAAAEAPVLGGLFRVLTVRSFTDADGDRTVTVEQPAVEDESAFAAAVNAEIQKRVEEKTAEGERLVAEYKEAFFATGGTQEDWERHENAVSVTYAVKSRTDSTVSFVVDSSVSIASAYHEQFFYNLDLAAGKELTLADVLGEDWVAVANDAITAQMAAAEDPSVYFGPDMGGFVTVDETTPFYLNGAGDPVVVFPRGSVAVGAMGDVEFEIVK